MHLVGVARTWHKGIKMYNNYYNNSMVNLLLISESLWEVHEGYIIMVKSRVGGWSEGNLLI